MAYKQTKFLPIILSLGLVMQVSFGLKIVNFSDCKDLHGHKW